MEDTKPTIYYLNIQEIGIFENEPSIEYLNIQESITEEDTFDTLFFGVV